MGLLKTNPQNELGDIISEPCIKFNRFRVINHIVFTFWLRGLYRNGGSKFISMALAKTNPQNELGDIISEPCINFNRFRVVNQIGFFIFFSEDFAGMAGLSSYLWPL